MNCRSSFNDTLIPNFTRFPSLESEVMGCGITFLARVPITKLNVARKNGASPDAILCMWSISGLGFCLVKALWKNLITISKISL